MPLPKIHLFILAGLAISASAQSQVGSTEQIPSQAKQLQGVLVPVPKKIFNTLDAFRGANWQAVQRPEIAHWKSHGDQVQIAFLLGVVVGEGFITMEAKDSTEVRNVGNTVLKLAGALGVQERALRRSRSITEDAEKNDWAAARKEWNSVLSDLENGMIELKSEHLSQLVSVGGWLRGTEALCALVLQNYSSDRAELIRQPVMLDYLEKQLLGMNGEIRNRPMVAKMLEGIQRIRALTSKDKEPPTEKTVQEIEKVCEELVTFSSRQPT